MGASEGGAFGFEIILGLGNLGFGFLDFGLWDFGAFLDFWA